MVDGRRHPAEGGHAFESASGIHSVEAALRPITTPPNRGEFTISNVIAFAGGTIPLADRPTFDGRGRPRPSVPPAPWRHEWLPATTVLTMQAKKADIDAFGKGDLDFEQFRQKVKSFTY